MKLTVFIPCFNEKFTILKAIEEAKKLNIDKEIIVVDNCSTDGTREILENLKDDSLRVVLQPRNFDVGRSAKVGISMARGEYFYGTGADLEYKMTDVYKMLDKIESENLDSVFGSRLADRKDVSKIQIIKERPYSLGTLIGTYLINKWYGRNFTDILGAKLTKASVLKEINLKSDNQSLEFELVSRLCKGGCRIEEIPIDYKPRTRKEGKKVKPWDMIPALFTMVKVKLFAQTSYFNIIIPDD